MCREGFFGGRFFVLDSRGAAVLCCRQPHRSGGAVMPLSDHFQPPLYPHHHWESFHSNWATRIADGIAALLPPEFQVEEHTHAGPGFEIDVATYEGHTLPTDSGPDGPALATRAAPPYAPPVPDGTMP